MMITKNGKGMGCESAGRNMEDTGKHFAGNFVHIRDHQQEAL